MAKFRLTPVVVLPVLALVTVTVMALFLLYGAKGSWSFILAFRGGKIAVMALVAIAIGVSTVMFQTVTNNRILTPALMGFDQLYVLIQTLAFFFFGAAVVTTVDPGMRFYAEVAAMVTFSVGLYTTLFSSGKRSLHLLILVGIVFGIFFRSLAGFLQRVLDPNEFSVLQDRFFASFNSMEQELAGVAALTLLAVLVVVWRMLPTLDVLALGREQAINLGVNHRRSVSLVLILVAVMVSISTALVGPMTFLGLLVANLAYLIAGTHRHRVVLPVAAMLGMIMMIGGQFILERVLAFDANLRVIIDFVGGILFLALLLRGVAR